LIEIKAADATLVAMSPPYLESTAQACTPSFQTFGCILVEHSIVPYHYRMLRERPINAFGTCGVLSKYADDLCQLKKALARGPSEGED
jgi:hypothetical protein